MRSGLVLVIVGILAGVTALALRPSSDHHAPSPCGPVDQTPRAIGTPAAGAATICLLNQERTSRGVPPLAQAGVLNQAAQEHSDDMVQRGYFEHTTPDGRTVQDRLRALGFGLGGGASGGENIEWGLRNAATPAATVRKWMASPPHRADILRAAFRQIGVGIALGTPFMPVANGATYTTDFGGVTDPTLRNG